MIPVSCLAHGLKVFKTDAQVKRKRGRPKIKWKNAIQLDLEKYWIESEQGDGQGDME